MLHIDVPPWFRPMLQCVACKSVDLDISADRFQCGKCGARYPVSNGVPMLLDPSSYVDTAATLAGIYGGGVPENMEKALGTALRYRMNDTTLRGEFSQIIDRHTALFKDIVTPAPAGARLFELKAEYFNPRFAPGESSHRSIRIRNNSDLTLASTGANPSHLSYYLLDPDGVRAPIEGGRSKFPVALKPGYELTVPLKVTAPATPGRYLIRVLVVQEWVRWFDDCPVFEGVVEVAETGAIFPEIVRNPDNGYFDFDGDLAQCGVVIQRAVDHVRGSSRDGKPIALELACGSDPQSLRHFQAGTNVVACDLCFPQVQIAAINFAHASPLPPNDYFFVSADVFAPPFREGSCDVVMISAALHHFTDVTDALKRMRLMLRPGGVVVLLREPCLVAAEDPGFLMELENGFNEQMFELSEYETMFTRAGLKPVYHQIDFKCSYKGILTAV